MKVFDYEQYSPAWWDNRRGVPTASEFNRILTPAKWQYAAGAEGYACELVGQLYDIAYGQTNDFATTAMRNGTIMEPEARRFYSLETGSDVQQVGFCLTDDGRFGCSPDGLVGDDGGLELKHPLPATQVEWLMAGVVPPKYLAQIHGSLLITKRSYWDYLSYYPGMEPLLIRVLPDEKTVALAEALEKFWVRLTEIRTKIAGTLDPVAATREEYVSPF